MVERSAPKTLIETRFIEAMQSAPSTIRLAVTGLGAREKPEVEKMCRAACVEVSAERLKFLSELLAFELLTSNPSNIIGIFNVARRGGDLQETSECFSRFAPTYRLEPRVGIHIIEISRGE